MARPLIALALGIAAAPLLALSTPALAQQHKEQLVIVYGDDPCPASADGEIVVCARKPESERYRIPEALRKSRPAPDAQSWAERARSMEYIGRTGTNSCSTSGAGGWTGCYRELMRQAREEEQAGSSSATNGQ